MNERMKEERDRKKKQTHTYNILNKSNEHHAAGASNPQLKHADAWIHTSTPQYRLGWF